MASINCKGQLDFLSDENKKQLTRHLGQIGQNVMPHQLAVLLGITYSQALAILVILDAEKISKNKLLIYHICEPDVPAGAIPYGKGFPNLPWSCPQCEEKVNNFDDLSFDIMAQLLKPVVFT
jgi:hypothetical protein